jgi:formylglycine-generating enzyme required for sulfatase activity
MASQWWVALLGLSFVSGADASQPVPANMVKVPEMSLQLGIDLDGIISATELCTDERDGRPCEPEEFVIEKSVESWNLVPSFYLDKWEVSVADYDQCFRAGRCGPLPYERLPLAFRTKNLPVVLVSQGDAATYCKFQGKRLASEAEFEAAARGPERRLYPWGFFDHRKRANSGGPALATSDDTDGYDLLAPITAFREGQSPEGALQLAGNVAEWTSTVFGPHGEDAPPGQFVVKGGSFSSPRVSLRSTARIGKSPGTRAPDIGFRCARSALVETQKNR